jgi:hypothetical protein
MVWICTIGKGVWVLMSDALESLETGALVLLPEWEG